MRLFGQREVPDVVSVMATGNAGPPNQEKSTALARRSDRCPGRFRRDAKRL